MDDKIPLFIQFASRSLHPKHRHASIIFYDGNIVAISNNIGGQHAEVRALQIAHIYGYYKELTLISIAITKGGKLKLAKPCIDCETYLRINGVKNIFYSTRKQTIERLVI